MADLVALVAGLLLALTGAVAGDVTGLTAVVAERSAGLLAITGLVTSCLCVKRETIKQVKRITSKQTKKVCSHIVEEKKKKNVISYRHLTSSIR